MITIDIARLLTSDTQVDVTTMTPAEVDALESTLIDVIAALQIAVAKAEATAATIH